MEIRGGLPELQRGVESVSNVLSLEIGTMSTVVIESNRALKDDTRATRRFVDLSLRSQQEQLHRIESQLNSLCGELDLSQISRKNRDRASVSSLPGNYNRAVSVWELTRTPAGD